MSALHHQTKVRCDLFNGDVSVCFISSGRIDNLELRVLEAWVEIQESGTVTQLNTALTRTNYSRPRLIDLPRETFPLIRLGAWDDLLDAAQRDRDPSLNGERLQAAE